MKIKTAELTGLALNWAVAKCQGHYLPPMDEYKESWFATRLFFTDWSIGGPIIERQRIQYLEGEGGTWDAFIGHHESAEFYNGPTPLVAAMRCFVASKLGDEVEVPDELCNN